MNQLPVVAPLFKVSVTFIRGGAAKIKLGLDMGYD